MGLAVCETVYFRSGQKIMQEIVQVGGEGIDPGTSRIQSERSAI